MKIYYPQFSRVLAAELRFPSSHFSHLVDKKNIRPRYLAFVFPKFQQFFDSDFTYKWAADYLSFTQQSVTWDVCLGKRLIKLQLLGNIRKKERKKLKIKIISARSRKWAWDYTGILQLLIGYCCMHNLGGLIYCLP